MKHNIDEREVQQYMTTGMTRQEAIAEITYWKYVDTIVKRY